MTICTCEHCGYPRVSLIWDDEMKAWTGKCMECRAIVWASKHKVAFL